MFWFLLHQYDFTNGFYVHAKGIYSLIREILKDVLLPKF